MKTKIITGFTTFIIVTCVMAATTLNLATAQDNSLASANYNDSTLLNDNSTNKYLGSYSITSTSVNQFVNSYLKDTLKINSTDPNFNEEFDLLANSLNKSELLRESLIGELTYTLNDKKLIIQDIAGNESFVMDYEIIDDILYAKVYNFSEELAVGHFVDNGKFLIVNSPDTKNSIFLERHLS